VLSGVGRPAGDGSLGGVEGQRSLIWLRDQFDGSNDLLASCVCLGPCLPCSSCLSSSSPPWRGRDIDDGRGGNMILISE
jgi:hypothetical protein